MPRKIEIKYSQPDNYRPLYANGAYGNITPQGEIVVNFYFENNEYPDKQTFNITEEDKLGEPEKPEDPEIPKIIRSVNVGVILDLNSAKRINEWLAGKIKQLEKMKSEGENND